MGFEINNGRLEKYIEEPGVTSIVVPNGVEVIGESAFANCRQLESIILNEGIKSIESNAFKYCVKLKHLVIPNSVKSDRFDRVVIDCWELEELILPEQVTVIKGVEWYEGGALSIDGCNKLECLVCPGIQLGYVMKKENAALTGFIKYSEMFNNLEVRKSYEEYIIKYKKRMYPIILKYDAVNVLKLYAESGKIKKSNFDEFIDPALEAKATACVAYLLQWKQEEIGDKTENKKTKKAEKKVVKKRDPEEVRLSRLWKYRVEDDNTITICEYKSEETEIVVPSKIGELPVRRIESHTFRGYQRGNRNKRASLNSELKSIEIENGIQEIGHGAFSNCHKLKMITIPESVVELGVRIFEKCESLLEVHIASKDVIIEDDAFSGCSRKLTLYARSGSYAESYAKEHNIPFVAE